MERYSLELTTAMARHADVDVLALPGKTDGSPPSAIMLTGFLLRAATQLAAGARRYDVVQFGDFVLFPLTIWTAIVAPRTRRLVAIHGLYLLFARGQGWKSPLYAAYFGIARRFQGAAHGFAANSAATATAAAEMGTRGAVPVPLGVTLDGNTSGTSGPDVPKGRYLLFVGRIVPRKASRGLLKTSFPNCQRTLRSRSWELSRIVRSSIGRWPMHGPSTWRTLTTRFFASGGKDYRDTSLTTPCAPAMLHTLILYSMVFLWPYLADMRAMGALAARCRGGPN